MKAIVSAQCTGADHVALLPTELFKVSNNEDFKVFILQFQMQDEESLPRKR